MLKSLGADELLESMGVNIPEGDGPPQKKPNQSVEAWLNSEEYKAWESSQ